MWACECSVEWGQSLRTFRELLFMLRQFGRSGRRQASILLLCGKKVIFDRQVYTVSCQLADMPVIWIILPEHYPGGWRAHSVDVHPSIIRAALLAGYSSEGNSASQTGRLDTAQGLKRVLRPWGEPWHGMEALRAGQPHTPPQPLAVPPSIQTSSLWSCPPGHLVLPFPVPIQMLADAKWYLQPPKATAKEVTQTGPGACGQWAQWEPGRARVRYSQVCPGRAGTARFYHNIQVFPLPALSLAVNTELEHKHSNLQEKNKKQEKGAPMSIAAPHSLPFPEAQLLLPLLLPVGAHASSDTQENILFCVKG